MMTLSDLSIETFLKWDFSYSCVANDRISSSTDVLGCSESFFPVNFLSAWSPKMISQLLLRISQGIMSIHFTGQVDKFTIFCVPKIIKTRSF